MKVAFQVNRGEPLDIRRVQCGVARAQRRFTRLEVDMPCSQSVRATTGTPSLGLLLGNVKGAVFLTQVHPVPAQAGLSSWPVGRKLSR